MFSELIYLYMVIFIFCVIDSMRMCVIYSAEFLSISFRPPREENVQMT